MFVRSRKLVSSLFKPNKLNYIQRRIHIQSETLVEGMLTFHHLRNNPLDYKVVAGDVSKSYKDNAWMQVKALLKGNRVYQFLHNSEVIKTNDTPGHTVIAGHLSVFMTDKNAAIIPASVMCMRDSSYVVDIHGNVQTINGEWFDVPTRQLIYKVNYVNFETEINDWFFGYDLHERKLVEMTVSEDKRQGILERHPKVVAELGSKDYVQFSGKQENLQDPEDRVSTNAMMQILELDKLIPTMQGTEAGDILEGVFRDNVAEKQRTKYVGNTKFFSHTAARSFFRFWESLSEDNRRTIAINQSEPLCAEVVFYQGLAYQGLGDYITASQRFQKAMAMDDQYREKAERELGKIDTIISSRPRRN